MPVGGMAPVTTPMFKNTWAASKVDVYKRQTYGDVAEAALKCGFDMLFIHGGHGLCLSQFYSPVINKRDDEFGPQCLENRMR